MATQDDYLQAILALLPQGRIWNKAPDSPMSQALAGLADSFARLDNRAQNLITDAFVGSTVELLPEWEESLGLPDPCLGDNPTVDARRAEAVARFVGTGGQSVPFFTRYAELLGYQGIRIVEFSPFFASRNRAGDPLYGEAGGYLWEVIAPASLTRYFRAGISTAGEPLASLTSTVLECEFRRLKPAHTELYFSYAAEANPIHALIQFPRFVSHGIGADLPATGIVVFPAFNSIGQGTGYNDVHGIGQFVMSARAIASTSNNVLGTVVFPTIGALGYANAGDAPYFRTPYAQPFSQGSVWNQSIGSGVIWSSNTDGDTVAIRQLQMAVDTSITVSVGQISDPVIEVVSTNTNAQQRDGNLTAFIHIPVNTQFPSGRAVFFDTTQPSNVWYFDNLKVTNSAGTQLSATNTNCIVTGKIGERDVTYGSGTDADTLNWGYNAAAGMIRYYEWQQGIIDHSLRFSLPATKTAVPGAALWPGYKVPNFNGGGVVPFGSTIGIPSNVNISNIGLSSGGLLVAAALQKHGAIMREVHTRTDIGVQLYAEPALASDPLFQQAQQDLINIIPQYLSVMRNQGPTTINGGGVPMGAPVPQLDPNFVNSLVTTPPAIPQGLTAT